jgi:ribonuclease BN (tRNA processing enzyme)
MPQTEVSSGMLSLTLLGSGTSVPSARRRAPAHLVQHGDTNLLVDCGSGATHGLARAGLTLDRLSGLALTHLHPDHTGDLVSLLFALSNPVGPQRAGELPLYGPEGTAKLLEGLRSVYGRWVEPRGGPLAFSALSDGASVTLGELTVRAFSVVHVKGSFALRFEAGGRAIAFSGDSGPCPGLERAAQGADLFLCECASREGDTYKGHMGPADVGRCASAAGCREVVLTHLYDGVDEAATLGRVRELFGGPVRFGEDGLRIDLG